MVDTNRTQVAAGATLLLVGTVILLGTSGDVVGGVPAAIASVAALGLAAGALLVGTSNSSERPV